MAEMVGSNERRSAMQTTVRLEGLESVIESLKKIESDMTKRRRLLSILRAQSKPYLRALNDTVPVSNRNGRKHSQLNYNRKNAKGQVTGTDINYTGAGNLRRSMRMYNNRRNAKGLVYTHVGPQAKKPRGSGFYGYYLLPGASKRIREKTDWKGDAYSIAKEEVAGGLSKELIGYLKRSAKRNGWNVDHL